MRENKPLYTNRSHFHTYLGSISKQTELHAGAGEPTRDTDNAKKMRRKTIETGPSTSSAHFHGVGGAAATPLGSLSVWALDFGGGGNLWQARCGWLLRFLDELC